MASFKCRNCSKSVLIKAPGTKNRNHCPSCLYSLHVDNKIGDRASFCGGLMSPAGKLYKLDGEEMLIHKCILCGFLRKNRVAGDDNAQAIENLQVFSKEL